jgi:hypothetical protein
LRGRWELEMTVKLSRRELSVLALAPRLLAQEAAPQPDHSREAFELRRKQSEALARREVPMSTEPAFIFKP